MTIASTDHGGTGPDLVLMHGAGGSQASMKKVLAHLTGELRVVTFDFRGHGHSPMGEWTLETAVADLEEVIARHGLDNPAVAGHSLGGMVAVAYAGKHPDCPAAINIDGHGMGVPSQYVGKDPVLVAEWMRGAKQRADALTQGPLMKVIGLLGRLSGSKPVDPAAMPAITSLVDGLDLIAMYAEVKGPLQVFNACAPATGLNAKLMKDPDHFVEAYRAGIRRDVTELAKTHPLLELAEIDAGHMLIATHPQQTAELMKGFLRRTAS